MEFLDMWRSPYASLGMPVYPDLQQQPDDQAQYAIWDPQMMAVYHHQQQQQQQHQQHQQRVAMMGHAALHGLKPADSKPRLSKEEVELLEGQFAKNPKPNSNTKRELAANMSVEVARINNWFQNRRAKEKHIKRTADPGAAKVDREGESFELSSPKEPGPSEFCGQNNTHQSLGPSSARFGDDDGKDVAGGEKAGANADADVEDDTDPRQRASDEATELDNMDDLTHAVSDSPVPGLQHAPAFDSFNPAQPTHFLIAMEQPGPKFNPSIYQDERVGQPGIIESYPGNNGFDFPAGAHEELHFNMEQHLSPSPLSRSPHLTSTPLPPPPPPTNLRFKSPPPPTDIAGRRNMRRPTPLGLGAERSISLCHGIKTGGLLEASRRCEGASPLRRIASASGMSGRVQKQTFASGPRSPYSLDRTKEVLLLGLQQQQQQQQQVRQFTRSPSMSTLGSTMSPVTPDGLSATGGPLPYDGGASVSPCDDSPAYTFANPFNLPLVSIGPSGDGRGIYPASSCSSSSSPCYPSFNTPPDTPALPPNLGDTNNSFATAGRSSATDLSWDHFAELGPGFSKAPLPTTVNCGLPSELDYTVAGQHQQFTGFPPPGSQPITPSSYEAVGGGCIGSATAYASFVPTPVADDIAAALLNNGTDYNYADAYAPEALSGRSSPGAVARARQFQFKQNITPQDFHHEN